MASAMTEGIFGARQQLSSSLSGPEWTDVEHSTGTSIMAVEFDGGVVIGADSRTTTGSYVFNRVTNKLAHITDNIYALCSGSAADTQAISDIVKYHLSFHRIELGEEPRVESGATLFRNLCYNYRDSLAAGMIIGGWDKYLGGQVYSIPIGGMLSRMPVAVGGSGSTYIYGYVDSAYKPNMTKEECLSFTIKALALAMSRDCSSGGVIRLAVITKEGVTHHTVTGDDVPKPLLL